MDKEEENQSLVVMKMLKESGWHHTVHKVEKKTGLFFDPDYFCDLVLVGEFTEAESYFSHFTKLEDSRTSAQMYFKMRKQKYFEALVTKDFSEAIQICYDELQVFSRFEKRIFDELVSPLMLEDIEQQEKFKKYRGAHAERWTLVSQFRKLIPKNAVFKDKLQFPDVPARPANPFQKRRPKIPTGGQDFDP